MFLKMVKKIDGTKALVQLSKVLTFSLSEDRKTGEQCLCVEVASEDVRWFKLKGAHPDVESALDDEFVEYVTVP